MSIGQRCFLVPGSSGVAAWAGAFLVMLGGPGCLELAGRGAPFFWHCRWAVRSALVRVGGRCAVGGGVGFPVCA